MSIEVNSPNCSECHSPMSIRTARRGGNRGNKFWGCSAFPECRGLRNIDENQEDDGNIAATINQEHLSIPKRWRDSIQRKGWFSEYISVGSLPSFASHLYREKNKKLFKILSQSLFLENNQKEWIGTDSISRSTCKHQRKAQ